MGVNIYKDIKRIIFFLCIIFSFSIQGQTISGNVFEDINYGGGSGRSYALADVSASTLTAFNTGDIGTATATVQLWNATGTTLVSSQPTNSSGNYSFNVSANTTYRIRIVNPTVKSKRPLLNGTSHTEIGIQTFRSESIDGSGTLIYITNEIGGRFPQNTDAAATTFTGAQTWSTVVMPSSGNVTNINFGFNFSTIVNTNDSGQGSLRQFILNSNKLDNDTTNLAQDITGVNAGVETSVFMIPAPDPISGLDPYGRTIDANYQTSGNNINALLITLVAGSGDLEITDNNTHLDATTQTTNIGDTNTGEFGTGGTVGTDGITFNKFQKKEIVIDLNTRGLEIKTGAQDVKIKGFALYNGGRVDFESGNLESAVWIDDMSDARAIVEDNIFGYFGNGNTPSQAILNNQRTAIRVRGKSIIQHNLFGNFTRYDIIVSSPNSPFKDAASGSILRGNESSFKTNPTDRFVDTYAIYDPDVIIEENLLKNFNQGNNNFSEIGGVGIEVFLIAKNVQIRNNTIDNMPVTGIKIGNKSDGAIIEKNIIKNTTGVVNPQDLTGAKDITNSGNAILVENSNDVKISQNSIYNNNTLGIDLEENNTAMGFVSKNDNGDGDGGANGQLNFPILAEGILNGNNIIIRGFAKPGASIEFFIADTDPFNGSATAGDNTFSGSTRDYGEGQIYLGTLVEGSSADQDNNTGSYNIDGNTETNINKFEINMDITMLTLPAGVTIQKMTTITATATFGNITSEFSPTISIVNPNDYDCDGIDNSVDLDDDNDGIPDSVEGTGDFDGDGIPNHLDLDSDGDGILDIIESGLPNISTLDTNNDGVIDLSNSVGANGLADVLENNDTPTATITYTVTNTEGDANFDFLDLDSDNDGITDLVEAQDPSNYITPSGNDANNNGIDDIFESNPITPINSDNNGKPNYQDIDSDDDGIPDNVEGQTTAGYLPPLGTDADGDGLDDQYDNVNNTGINPLATSNLPDYINTDSDADGLPDIQENGMTNSISGVDTDGDGLDDAFEGLNNNDGFDVNDEINTPNSSILPNTNNSGDLDYREGNSSIGPYNKGSLWLRGDIGVNSILFVSLWEDQSGLSRDFSPVTFGSGNFNTLNFNKTVSFTGSESFQYTGVLDPRSMFIVYNDVATQTSTTPFTNDTGIGDGYIDDTRIYGTVPSSVYSFFGPKNYINGNVEFAYNNTPRPDNFQLHSRIYTANPSQNSETYYLGKDNTLANPSFGGITGNIAEVILYSDVITAIERQVVETYLAIKYGFTLGILNDSGDIIEGDYVLSDEITKVWNYTANSTYHNNVTGIGKDEGWNFFQKQSKSSNSDALVTIGLTDIATNNISNTSTLTDKSYLVWGHNNVALATTSSQIPNVPTQAQCVTNETLNRVWKIIETGAVGTVEIAFTKSTIDATFTTLNSQKVLVIADDASLTQNIIEVELDEETINSVLHYTGKYNFNGTKYFTIADKKEIEWLGSTSSWRRGSGSSGSPNSSDIGRLLIIDAQGTTNHANLVDSVKVKCAYIKANSKLVVPTDKFIEIADDLVLDGEIRLVGDGQLIQTHSGASKVYGTGKLYKDQEAVVPSVYRYHYWSSPVTEVGSNTFRVGEVVKDGTITTSETSEPLDINWVGGNNYDGAPGDYTTDPNNPVPITMSSYWVYTLENDPGDGSKWIRQRETGVINKGNGFLMKSTGATTQNFTFVGTPIDGGISLSIDPNTSTLFGNPYPSALDAYAFIDDNILPAPSIDGTLLFWEHTGEDATDSGSLGHNQNIYNGGYSILNRSMSISARDNATSINSVYDWENGIKNGNVITETKTIVLEGTTYNFEATVSTTNSLGLNLVDKLNANGTSGDVIIKTAGLSVDGLKINFDNIVDLNSIHLYNEGSITTEIITITANNTNINAPIIQNLTNSDGETISLNFTDVSSITIESQNPNNLVLDEINFSKGGEISLGSATYNEPSRYIAVGQSFIVPASTTGGTVIFKNSQRKYRNDDYANGGTKFLKEKYRFKKQENQLPIIKLGMDFSVNNKILHRQIGISFKAENNFSYNNGYDSQLADLGSTDMYWKFKEIPDKKLIIAGVEAISDELEIPITLILSKNQSVNIMVDEIKNIDRNIFLLDKLTGIHHNLSKKITLSLVKGIYTSRFYLTFTNASLNTQDNKIVQKNLRSFFDDSTKEIVILNQDNLIIEKVELSTILGQKIKHWDNLKSILENRFKTKYIPSAIYILNIKTNNGFINKKIFIK